ncbi:MAG: TatD family hydrolase [candidate division KSB1 bacterium]|nr:TatD family hydrolase [candidate division KSB1 bacterium]
MEQLSTNIQLIDSHAHLDFENFDGDREAVIQNAQLAGVVAIINIGIDFETRKRAIALAEAYPLIYATVGIHPHDAAGVIESDWRQLEALIAHPKVVAIGEIGLDYFRTYAPRDVQMQVLQRQLELAVQYRKPVVIHTRHAWPDILPIFTATYRRKLTGVFHCFSGSENEAKAILDAGYFISFTGVVTFKNATALKIAANHVPLDRLLLETDCPFMAPEPFRGRRCEPAYLPYIAQKIADAKAMSLAEIAEQTTRNVTTLFGISLKKDQPGRSN